MTPKLQRLFDAVQKNLGVVSVERLGEITVEVKAEAYLNVARTLRDHPELRFEQLMDLCGVDYAAYGDRPREGKPRFAAVLHLLSQTHNWRLRLRTFAPDDAMPILPSSASCSRAIPICDASSRTMGSSGIRSARTSRCRATSRCATTPSRSA
jgi:NADH-quinone oxidoreductase subunit C